MWALWQQEIRYYFRAVMETQSMTWTERKRTQACHFLSGYAQVHSKGFISHRRSLVSVRMAKCTSHLAVKACASSQPPQVITWLAVMTLVPWLTSIPFPIVNELSIVLKPKAAPNQSPNASFAILSPGTTHSMYQLFISQGPIRR